MAVVVKSAKKGVIFSYSSNESGTKYRILNLEENYNKKPFDIKLLNNKGVDIVASGEAFVSDIVFPENQNLEILTPEFYKIDKNLNAYCHKLKQLSKEYRSCYDYYCKEPIKTVDYYDQAYFALTYKMRGFKDLHSKLFADDQKNIDGVTAYSIFLTLKAKHGELEDYEEFEEEEEEEEEESEYEPGDEIESNESEEDSNGNNEEKETHDSIKAKHTGKNKESNGEGKDTTKGASKNEGSDRESEYKTKSTGNDKKVVIDPEAKIETKHARNNEETDADEKDKTEGAGTNNENECGSSNEEDEYSDTSEEWETEEEEIDWDSEDELNLILYKDKPESTNKDDKAWIYHYFGREYSPLGSMKWYTAFRSDESFYLSTRNRYGSPDSHYWDCIPDYLEYAKKPKGLKPCHIKAFKDIDFNCIYVEHESIIPESIEIRKRDLPKMFTKQSKVFDLYDKDAEKPYGTIIEISFSPPLTDYNYHSDEGFYEAGVNLYSNNQGIVLTGEQNIPTIFYGMAIYEGIIIPDVFYDTP